MLQKYIDSGIKDLKEQIEEEAYEAIMETIRTVNISGEEYNLIGDIVFTRMDTLTTRTVEAVVGICEGKKKNDATDDGLQIGDASAYNHALDDLIHSLRTELQEKKDV